MNPKFRLLLLVLSCLLIGSSYPAITRAQEQLAYVQWSPFPDIISAKTSDEIVLLSPELKEIDRWRITDNTGHEIISYYAWSPNGELLAIMLFDEQSSFNTSVLFWDVHTQKRIAKVDNILPSFVGWSYDSQFIAVDSQLFPNQNEVWFIHAPDGNLSYRWSISTSNIVWHPMMSQIATISNGVQLWDVTTFPPQEVARLPMAYSGIGLAYDATGSQILFSELNRDHNEVSIYDTQTLQRVQILNTGDTTLIGFIGAVSWDNSPLTVLFGENVSIWNPDTGDMIWKVSDLGTKPGDLAYLPSWNPDGTKFVLNDEALGIHIRDGRTGEILARMDDAMPEMP